MECPRCGFNQPEDRYCANCGLDVESYMAKPKPLLSRLLQNANLYLALTAVLVVGLVFYIFISQKAAINHEVHSLFKGLPLMSRDAGDFTQQDSKPIGEKPFVSQRATDATKPLSPKLKAKTAAPDPAAVKQAAVQAAPEPTYSQLDVDFLEISKENISAVAASGKVLTDSADWRVIKVDDAQQADNIRSAGRPLPGRNQGPVRKERFADVMGGDENPLPQQPFLNFSLEWHKANRSHWEISYRIPGLPDRNTPPGSRKLVETNLDGMMNIRPGQAILFIYDPLRRIPMDRKIMNQLADSPLRVLLSEDFRQGFSALVIWIQFR